MWHVDPLLSSDSKQWPLLGNTHNAHAGNSRMKELCIPFLTKGLVNMPTTIGVLLEMVFSIRSMQSGYKESSYENWRSNSIVPGEQLVESWEDGVESSGVEC
jgi:hypothetical protein